MPVYELRVSHAAHHQIRRLPAHAQERVNTLIAALTENPRPTGAKKLVARDGYRVRVGDFRILCNIDDTARLVVVYRVKSRGDAYRP